MWETIKNDPLLRTISIVILGVLAFGLAFNIMFGSNGVGMEMDMGMGMSGGNSLNNTLSVILAILMKVLLITIIITAIVAVFKYSRKYLGGTDQPVNDKGTKLYEYIKADPVLRTVTVVVLSILLIGIIFAISNSMFGFNRPYGMYSAFSLTAIIIYLVKLLLTASILGLIVGSIVLLIQNAGKFNFDMVKSFNNEKQNVVACVKCGANMQTDWKCCPKCGQDVEA